MNGSRTVRRTAALALSAILLSLASPSLATMSPGQAFPDGDADPTVMSAYMAAPGLALETDEAPFGVDPIVTGPISASFNARRQAAGCDEAVWPNIPRACYPD